MDLLCALPKAEALPCCAEAVLAVPASLFAASAEEEECALPCAALFGLDAFPSLDAFIDSADFDGARAAARARARRLAAGAAAAWLFARRLCSHKWVPTCLTWPGPPRRAAALASMECATDALLQDAWPPRCDVSEATVRGAPRQRGGGPGSACLRRA
jgi:hypothetical protein